jgi:peptidoglycan/xylan/chitin deacetylase (PgdA/CDA1 family)
MKGQIFQTKNTGISYLLPLKHIIRLSGQKIILPVYHTVSDTPLRHLNFLYYVKSIRMFKKDLDFFLKYFRPISVSQLHDHVQGNTVLKKNSFLLSFDDGLRECYDIIVPILKQKGIPAIFFVNGDFIDNKDMLFRFKVNLLLNELNDEKSKKEIVEAIRKETGKIVSDTKNVFRYLKNLTYSEIPIIENIAANTGLDFKRYREKEKPYLSLDQLKSMSHQGFDIGAHSMDHPQYNLLSFDEMVKQTIGSLDYIKETGIETRYFSFPFTDVGITKAFFKKIESKVNLTFGGSGLKRDIIPFNVHRVPMEDSQLPAIVRVKNEYLYYLLKSLINKNTLTRN